MNDPCERLEGRPRRVCSGEEPMMNAKRVALLKKWHSEGIVPRDVLDDLGIDPSVTIGRDFGRVSVPVKKSLGEGPGTELLEAFRRMGVPSCQLCRDAADRMNEWGTAGCRERIDEIVEDILPRAEAWWESSSLKEKADAWFADQASAWEKVMSAGRAVAGRKAMLRDAIRRAVVAAIESAERRGAGS